METLPSCHHLFRLLDAVSATQRDIAEHLGVSQPLVSVWRSGQKAMPAKHHAELLAWAQHTWCDQWVSTGDRDEDQTRHNAFVALYERAHVERNPAYWREKVQFYAGLIQTLVQPRDPPEARPTTPASSWADSLATLQGYAQEVVTALYQWHAYEQARRETPPPHVARNGSTAGIGKPSQGEEVMVGE